MSRQTVWGIFTYTDTQICFKHGVYTKRTHQNCLVIGRPSSDEKKKNIHINPLFVGKEFWAIAINLGIITRFWLD